jgi:hypothetical protein
LQTQFTPNNSWNSVNPFGRLPGPGRAQEAVRARNTYHILLGLWLFAVAASPIQGTPTPNSDSAFAVDTDTLGKKRRIKRESRPVEHLRRKFGSAKWEIRHSTESLTDCLMLRGTRKVCRDGGIGGGFESKDGKHVLIYTVGSSVSTPQEKSITVFSLDTGEKIREVQITGGGNMTAVADPAHDLLVAFFHDVGGKVVLQAFDMVGNLKWRREYKSRITPGNGPDSIAISADGRSIFLATIPVPLEPDHGTIMVLSDAGNVKRELDVGSQRIMLNPAKTIAAFWNRKGYQLYSIADDRIVLKEHCVSHPHAWCLTKGFSPDGRFLAVLSLEEDHRVEKKLRLTRVDAVDITRKVIHRDLLNEEIGSNLHVVFGSDGALSVQSSEKAILYEAVP